MEINLWSISETSLFHGIFFVEYIHHDAELKGKSVKSKQYLCRFFLQVTKQESIPAVKAKLLLCPSSALLPSAPGLKIKFSLNNHIQTRVYADGNKKNWLFFTLFDASCLLSIILICKWVGHTSWLRTTPSPSNSTYWKNRCTSYFFHFQWSSTKTMLVQNLCSLFHAFFHLEFNNTVGIQDI